MIALGAAAWAWQYTQRQIDLGQQQFTVAQKQFEVTEKQIDLVREQLKIAASQATTAQRQLAAMERDQRPFLWPVNKGSPTFGQTPDGLRILWNWEVQNVGKSAAVDVLFDTFLKVGDEPFKRSFLQTGAFSGNLGILPPNTDGSWGTVASRPGYGQRDFDRWSKVTDGIQLLVKLRYSDALDKSYDIAQCFSLLSTGAIARLSVASCEAQVAP